ncbi:RIIB lysis inhibitor [Vibrio phage 1.224.A._10N.261.48.B1]|uniref:RIIB protein n=1 Tax=Vibrio phage 1.224.A._10N.261.48.B1 TaxID=1881226 RepID=A0A2I7RRW2_9CAUD|nr:RIIB lysis inhibitor [Vibrio phage 1.224.A._10N.261.48.B1]AUR96392.1 RIIB protein [Vibrio phage 1.224.A._10N.261.48.B1]
MDKMKIVGIVVSPTIVTLYRSDGTTILVKQGDIADTKILYDAMDDIVNHQVALMPVQQKVSSAEFEIYAEQSAGVVKFFRVARKFAETLFAPVEELTPQEVGQTEFKTDEPEPVTPAPPVVDTVAPKPQISAQEQSRQKHRQAVKDIINDKPETRPVGDTTSSLHASQRKDNNDAVTVAVVGDTVLPNADNLKTQVTHATKAGRIKGMDNLMIRLSKMIHERQHSVEDLISFLKHADLPIMDDGSILAYKRVKILDATQGLYADSHTGKVKQKVGSVVQMGIDYVDSSRAASCSYGLHVASRSYLRSFHGGAILFIKIAPEDIIAVPTYDTTKIRCCRYHVIGKANDKMFDALSQNVSLGTVKGADEVIAKLLAGNHVGVTQYVTLQGRSQDNISYETAGGTSTPTKVAEEDVVPESAIIADEDVNDPSTPLEGKSLDAKEVAKKAERKSVDKAKPTEKLKETLKEVAKAKEKPKAKAKAKPKSAPKPKAPKKESPRAKLAALLPVTTEEQAQEALAIKRQAKKGWGALGVEKEQEDAIMRLLK